MQEEKVSCRKLFILLCAVAVLVLFAGIGFREIESGDETRVAGIAAEMFIEGDFLVPHLNGDPFMEYPPLYYWLTSAAYYVFGVNDFAAKLPSVLAALGMVLLTFAFARKLAFSANAAFFAGVILLFSSQFFPESRTCRVDTLLAFFIELAVFSFYSLTISGRTGAKIIYLPLFIAGLAGGVYTKGLLGIVMPLAVVAGWLVLDAVCSRKLNWRLYTLLVFGTAMAIIVVGIWYGLLRCFRGEELFNTVFWVNNLGRFTGSQYDHAAPFFYYLTMLPSLFMPWMPFLLLALIVAVKRLSKKYDRNLLLLVLAVTVPFVLLSMASGKRVVYLMPINAFCALITAWFLFNLPERVDRWLRRLPLRRIIVIVLAAAVFAIIAIDIGTALYMNRRESLRPMFEYCASQEKLGQKLFLIDAPERTRGAAYFYLLHNITEKRADAVWPVADECWILRQKRGDGLWHKYADRHIVINGADVGER